MAQKAPKVSTIQKLEGVLVILLTTASSAKSAISTVIKRHPYGALLIFLMVALTLPLLTAMVTMSLLFFSGAVSSTVFVMSIIAPVLLIVAWISFLLWLILVGGTYIYRRTLAGWGTWRQFVSKYFSKPKSVVEEPTQAMLNDFETQLASFKPPETDGWPVLSFDPLLDNQPCFEPLEKELTELDEMKELDQNTLLSSLKTPIVASTPDASGDHSATAAELSVGTEVIE